MRKMSENDLALKRQILQVNQQNADQCFMFYQEVLRDISICLENENLSKEERFSLIEKEVEIAIMVGQKEREIREMCRLLTEH